MKQGSVFNAATDKIPFAIFFNRAQERLNGWYGSLDSINADITVSKQDFTSWFKQFKSEEGNMMPEKRQLVKDKVIARLKDVFRFADYLFRWNMSNSILKLIDKLNDLRNFFSHGYHRPVEWSEYEIDTLNKLYFSLSEYRPKLNRQNLENCLLFDENKTLSYQGAIFFVSLFLTKEDVNQLFDLIYFCFRAEKNLPADSLPHRFLNFNPRREIYTFWNRRGDASLMPDNRQLKKFYDIVSFLRKCPEESLTPETEKLAEKYGVRESDKFIRHAMDYLSDFKALPNLEFFPYKNKKEIFRGNTLFLLRDDKHGCLKGMMGEEVLTRVLVRLFSGIPGTSIETEIREFIRTYYENSLLTIDSFTHPVPKSVDRKRKIAEGDNLLFEVLDERILRRLEFISYRLKDLKRESTSFSESQKADFIVRRWNRWIMYNFKKADGVDKSIKNIQFIKLRAQLTNFRKFKREIINELAASGYDKVYPIKELLEESDLETLYKKTIEYDGKFCDKFLANENERRKKAEAICKYVGLRPIKIGVSESNMSKMPVPIAPKAISCDRLKFEKTLVDLIDEYYPIRTGLNKTHKDNKPAISKERRVNKKYWKLKQRDSLLALIASEYLRNGIKKTAEIGRISLYRFDEDIVELKLKLDYTLQFEDKTADTIKAKKLSFTFDEFAKSRNRMILGGLKDIAFSNKFPDNEIDYSHIEPELETYLYSQIEFMRKILELEERLLKQKPELKVLSKKYVPFGDIEKNLDNLSRHFDKFKAAYPTDMTHIDNLRRIFRNSALHMSVPKIDDKVLVGYFQQGIDFINYYIEQQFG